MTLLSSGSTFVLILKCKYLQVTRSHAWSYSEGKTICLIIREAGFLPCCRACSIVTQIFIPSRWLHFFLSNAWNPVTTTFKKGYLHIHNWKVNYKTKWQFQIVFKTIFHLKNTFFRVMHSYGNSGAAHGIPVPYGFTHHLHLQHALKGLQ